MRKQHDKPAALDHVLYEIEMLTSALLALCRPGLADVDGSGWMEVFAIHARNLNEFFAQKDPGGGYMRPDDFVTWTYSYKFDKGLFRRASSQVAHLTYDRERPEDKTQWPFEGVFKALREQCIVFLEAVVLVEPLMAYRANRQRADALLATLPRIQFSNDKK
jgi:hypothetical protein